jgi:transketolase
MTSSGGASHIASIFSIADIVAVLYGQVLRVDPRSPRWPERDRFIISKGHAGAAIYAALAEKGFFDAALLKTYFKDGSILSGHFSHKHVPGAELSTGSLGHGLPVGCGMAYAAKLKGESHRVFVLLSDGECDEGSNWEAILFAPHHRLDKLVAMVDFNKFQSLDSVEKTLNLEPLADKWRSFGWAVKEVNGHDHKALQQILAALPFEQDKPSCLICHSVKGKGVSFMEQNPITWHYRTAKGEEFESALKELERA